MSNQASRGWPFADCTIHVQVRQKGKELDVDEIYKGCESFGTILKIYPWTSKKSSSPQAYVVFNLPAAVTNAMHSLTNRTGWLWKNGYHMLKMCESTSEMLESFFEKDRITRNHPMFENIPLKWEPRPCIAKKPPATRDQDSGQTHSIPTGPRYKPYSLDNRPNTSTSAQVSQPVKFPPKKEPQSVQPSEKVATQGKELFGSPPRPKFIPSKNWIDSSRLPSPAKPEIPGPSFAPPPSPPPSPRLSHVDNLQQKELNQKLKSDIQDLVSAHIDAAHKIQDLENENESLRKKLQASEEQLALSQTSVKSVEAREQTAIALLAEAETARDGARDACSQALAGIQELLGTQQAVEAAKRRTETELQVLQESFRLVVQQLTRAEERLGFRPPKPRVNVAVQSEPPRPDTEDASSVDQDDACRTPVGLPAIDYMHHSSTANTDLHNIPELLDAFKDIDDLVRTAFNAS